MFVDRSYCKDKKGNFQVGCTVTTQYELLERNNLPQTKSAQQEEFHVLTRACHLTKGQIVNTYTDRLYAFGSSMILRCYRNKGGFLTFIETPIKNEQVDDPLTAILLHSEIAVIKIEEQSKKIKPIRERFPYQGNGLADFLAKATVRISIQVVAHEEEVYSASTKMTPCSKTFAILMYL